MRWQQIEKKNPSIFKYHFCFKDNVGVPTKVMKIIFYFLVSENYKNKNDLTGY